MTTIENQTLGKQGKGNEKRKKLEWQETVTYQQQTTTSWGNEEKATKKEKHWNGKRQ